MAKIQAHSFAPFRPKIANIEAGSPTQIQAQHCQSEGPEPCTGPELCLKQSKRYVCTLYSPLPSESSQVAKRAFLGPCFGYKGLFWKRPQPPEKGRKSKETTTATPKDTTRASQRSVRFALELRLSLKVAVSNLNWICRCFACSSWLNFLLPGSPAAMNKKGDIPMGKPQEGPAVSEATWKSYLKKKKKEEKKAREQPKTIPARNFAAEAVRKAAEGHFCYTKLLLRKAAEAQGSGRAYQSPSLLRLLALPRGCEWVGRAGRDTN